MRIQQRRLDPSVWIKHFKEQAAGVKHTSHNGFIYLNHQTGGGANKSNVLPITMISPVQQGIERAKAQIKRKRKLPDSPLLMRKKRKTQLRYSDFLS
jgi:hypothetical protein